MPIFPYNNMSKSELLIFQVFVKKPIYILKINYYRILMMTFT